jgi:hypothetical protein
VVNCANRLSAGRPPGGLNRSFGTVFAGEARPSVERFRRLSPDELDALRAFLMSL